jgi:hypothetical protein
VATLMLLKVNRTSLIRALQYAQPRWPLVPPIRPSVQGSPRLQRGCSFLPQLKFAGLIWSVRDSKFASAYDAKRAFNSSVLEQILVSRRGLPRRRDEWLRKQ